MRCPKCGFISFDHLEACLKCGKDIKEAAENLHGSVYNVAAPAFLKFNTGPGDDEVELDEAFIDEEDAFADEKIRDPDLDILLNDGSPEEDEEVSMTVAEDEEEISVDFDQLADDEDGVDFKLDDFQQDAELGGIDDFTEESAPARKVNIELPDELSDISDLEPPAAKAAAAQAGAAATDDQDLDIDFDLNLDDEELGAVTEQAKKVDLADLSLQDLEFDEPMPAPAAPKKAPSGKVDLDDEEFNFDLDLGDLKLDDE